MSIEEFNLLDEQSKRVIIFEADKITERNDNLTKFQLYTFDDFFIETKTSRQNSFKRTISTYTVKELPFYYTNAVQAYLHNSLKELVRVK